MLMVLLACIWPSVLCYGKIVKHASPGKLTLNQRLAVVLILTLTLAPCPNGMTPIIPHHVYHVHPIPVIPHNRVAPQAL